MTCGDVFRVFWLGSTQKWFNMAFLGGVLGLYRLPKVTQSALLGCRVGNKLPASGSADRDLRNSLIYPTDRLLKPKQLSLCLFGAAILPSEILLCVISPNLLSRYRKHWHSSLDIQNHSLYCFQAISCYFT